LYIQDVARPTFARPTSLREAATIAFPIWVPDGRQVVYRTLNGLWVLSADGSAEAQLMNETSEYDYPGSVSADGETLVFMRGELVNQRALMPCSRSLFTVDRHVTPEPVSPRLQ
jgi:hypothetical protein